jgi:hypothetical protein
LSDQLSDWGIVASGHLPKTRARARRPESIDAAITQSPNRSIAQSPDQSSITQLPNLQSIAQSAIGNRSMDIDALSSA